MDTRQFLTALILCAFSAIAPAQVIISEIMYNPDSSEAGPNDVEWLEIYNTGATAVDISGWYINDNDGGDGATAAFPAGTMIAAGEAIVIVPEELAIADFQAAWGTGFQVIPVGGFVFGSTTGVFGGSINGLSGSPSATNEILELTDASNVVVDIVNFDDANGWPTDSPDGPSISLNANALDATLNDDGANWSRSDVGINGAFANVMTPIFGGFDSGSPGIVALPVATGVRLQILHASDLEGGVNAIGDAPNFAAVVEALEADAANNGTSSILLSAGDNYIPGPFFSAAGDRSLRSFFASFLGNPNAREGVGRVDVSIMNALGFDASAVGNHEFDAGTSIFESIIGTDIRNSFTQARWLGAQFPYLSANLDFSGDSNLSGLATTAILPNTAFRSELSDLVAAASAPKLAPATTITRNGEVFGVIGATTQLVSSISSTGGVVSTAGNSNDMVALAAVLQPTIDALVGSGINKIIIVSHLQQIALEQQLAGLLNGVDVIIAGGSDTLLADGDDVLRSGDVAAGTYPLAATDAMGNPVAIVSTAGEYSYVGRLVIDFDANGVIDPATIVTAESGIYATDAAGVARVNSTPFLAGSKSEAVQTLTNAVTGIVTAKDGNIFGSASVFLEGRREFVRTEETNMGNLTADANLAAAQASDPTVQVSHKNGGGIRAEIGSIDGLTGALGPTLGNPTTGKLPGQISQLDIENTLRFNNALSLVTLTRAQLKEVIEHAVAATATGSTPGQFGQWGGISFSFDPAFPAGSRVRFAALTDPSASSPVIVAEGSVVGERPVRIVTLNFLAGGGDSYPFPNFEAADPTFYNRVDLNAAGTTTGAATFAPDGTEQDALAEYLAANFSVTPFGDAETSRRNDNRVQNLSARSDRVLGFVNPAFQIDIYQDVANCGPLNVNVVGAAGRARLLNLVSVTPTGGSGPLFGIGSDAISQVLLPEGFEPFNVLASNFGVYNFTIFTPCTLPVSFEAISVELIGNQFSRVTAPTPTTPVSLGF